MPPFPRKGTLDNRLFSAFPCFDDTFESHPASPPTAALAKIGANLRPDRPPFCLQRPNWTHLRQPLGRRALDLTQSSGENYQPILPAHKLQSWREAPNREGSSAVAGPELLGGLAERTHEPAIGISQLAAHRLAGGMEGWRGRLLGLERPPKRILGEDCGRSSWTNACALSSHGGFGFDIRHQGCGPLTPLLLGQMLPAGERIELQHLPSRVLESIEGLSSPASRVLLRAVEPEPFQDLAFEQRPDGVDSGPIPRPFH